MLASESRQHAREALQGKWGKAALIILVYSLLTGLISMVLNLIPTVGSLAYYVIHVPLSFGLVVTLIKLKRGEETTYTEFFTNGFTNFASAWKVTLWVAFKLLVPIVLIIVSVIVMYIGFGAAIFGAQYAGVVSTTTTASATAGAAAGAGTVIGFVGLIGLIASSIWCTIKSYLFKPVLFLLYDNLDKTAKEVVENSAEVMKGNRWKWFCLELSFIGWVILAIFTFGIGMLWVIPYMTIAQIVFYEFLFGKKEETVQATAEGTTAEPVAEPIATEEPKASIPEESQNNIPEEPQDNQPTE